MWKQNNEIGRSETKSMKGTDVFLLASPRTVNCLETFCAFEKFEVWRGWGLMTSLACLCHSVKGETLESEQWMIDGKRREMGRKGKGEG